MDCYQGSDINAYSDYGDDFCPCCRVDEAAAIIVFMLVGRSGEGGWHANLLVTYLRVGLQSSLVSVICLNGVLRSLDSGGVLPRRSRTQKLEVYHFGNSRDVGKKRVDVWWRSEGVLMIEKATWPVSGACECGRGILTSRVGSSLRCRCENGNFVKMGFR